MVLTATVAKDGQTSGAIQKEGKHELGIILPSLDSCNITFTVCDTDAGTFVTLKGADGNAVTITATTGGFAIASDDLKELAAYPWFKIVCSVAQTTAARTFTIIAN